jgi:hypothetical protein
MRSSAEYRPSKAAFDRSATRVRVLRRARCFANTLPRMEREIGVVGEPERSVHFVPRSLARATILEVWSLTRTRAISDHGSASNPSARRRRRSRQDPFEDWLDQAVMQIR